MMARRPGGRSLWAFRSTGRMPVASCKRAMTSAPLAIESWWGRVPGASGPLRLGRCALVYMDDRLVHSPTLEQHLFDVAEALEMIFRRRRLSAKGSKCEFGRQD
jgi:hypothetical protein